MRYETMGHTGRSILGGLRGPGAGDGDDRCDVSRMGRVGLLAEGETATAEAGGGIARTDLAIHLATRGVSRQGNTLRHDESPSATAGLSSSVARR